MDDVLRSQLIEELAEKEADLRERLADLTRPVEASATVGFGKRIGDGTIQAVQQMADASTAKQLQLLLDEVLRAQAKFADGSYGRCDECGGDISDLRLEARPWSTRCVHHA